MGNELKFRTLEEKDYKTICKWWKWWRWTPIARESLPNNGMGGFMIMSGNINVCAGFLYTTNSNLCIVEWIISNHKVKNKGIRNSALKMLINTLSNEAKSLGFKIAFTYLLNENLKEKFEDSGFIKSTKLIEMIKTL